MEHLEQQAVQLLKRSNSSQEPKVAINGEDLSFASRFHRKRLGESMEVQRKQMEDDGKCLDLDWFLAPEVHERLP